MRQILTKIAEGLDALGFSNIVVGRFNYYEKDNAGDIIIDMQEMKPISYFKNDDGSVSVLTQGMLILEFRGVNADLRLGNFISMRCTDTFRSKMKSVEIFLDADISQMRDLKGTQYFNRYVYTAPCRFFVNRVIPEEKFTSIGKIHLYKED